MPAKVIIIEDLEFVRNNVDTITAIAKKESAVFLPLSDQVFLFLKSLELDCLDYRNFEEKNMYDDVYSISNSWGTEWYHQRGKDITEVENFSMGCVIEWSVVYFFSYFLRLHILLQQLIRKIDPKEIVLVTCKDTPVFQGVDTERISVLLKHIDLLPVMLNEYISEAGSDIKLKVINLDYVPGKKRMKQVFKAGILAGSLFMNSIISFLCSMRHLLNKGNKKILFFEGFHHLFGIMKLKELRGFEIIHLQKIIGPSLFFKLYRRGIRVESLRSLRRHSMKKKRLFHLDEVKSALSNFFIYQGEDILPHIWPRLEYLFQRLFPEIVYPDLLSARKILKRVSPGCLVLENDSTYYERLLVMVAKELKVKSLVVQHGVTYFGDSYKDKEVPQHGFFPTYCDNYFVFGEVIKDWFLNLGAKTEQITITGCPRFDVYYSNRKSRNNNPGFKKTVLVLLNDSWSIEIFSKSRLELSLFYNHMLQFIRLAKSNPEINFIMRPHFEDNIWIQLFKEELISLDNFTISRRQTLEELFLYVDLVVGYISTALLEAVIAGIPVVSLNIGGIIDCFPLWRFGLSREIREFENLEIQFKKLLFDENERSFFIGQTEKNVHLINYNHDGRATERVATQIINALS